MKYYRVYNRTFKNLHDATEYHLIIYGNANWQASITIEKSNNGYIHKPFKPIKKLIRNYERG